MVDVWSYKDLTLYSSQQAEPVGEPDYACVISLATKKVVRLEQKNERIVDNHHNWIVTVRQLGLSGIFEAGWNAAATISYSLISTLDGHVEYRIDDIDNLNEGFALSPAGKWLIFYDYAKRNFFSYEIATKKIRNITKKCLTTWTKEGGDMLKPALSWYPWEKTWLLNDDAVLISDNYDIWQVDPRCIREPINLTKGFGHANHIKFEIGSNAKDLQKFSVQANSLILLSAFNRINKDMGFCKIRLNESANPEILSMGPYLYGNINSGHDDYVNSFPASLHGGRYFLVLRQSATEAPNYFLTQDFKRFDRITDFSRHKKYNWLTAELVHWKTFDGVGASGILYKPENFNPKLKYPIIFEYYEKRSDMLNLFISPKFSDGRINIPWFVSRGFLVFVPDIHYKIGQAGQSAYNSVVSAARHLSKKTWVDSNRMGLQGHSWGAYQTNYIITRTGIFKAACSASGVSDLVSAYASDRRGGYRLYHAERGQGRLGGTIWQRRTNYIKNSPIIWADRITTPLLLMNNKKDKVVPFEQGLELFLALRRLKKPVWLLQYDNGYHVLGEDCARDYTVRMTQFFDHYLKGYPVPRWMSQGVAARKKGLEDGFDLVPHGNYGSDCQICLKGEQNIKGRQPD
jgi:dienelactone hydrolase